MHLDCGVLAARFLYDAARTRHIVWQLKDVRGRYPTPQDLQQLVEEMYACIRLPRGASPLEQTRSKSAQGAEVKKAALTLHSPKD